MPRVAHGKIREILAEEGLLKRACSGEGGCSCGCGTPGEKHPRGENYMSVQALQALRDQAGSLMGKIRTDSNLPDWVEAKLTEASQKLEDVFGYMEYGHGQHLAGQKEGSPAWVSVFTVLDGAFRKWNPNKVTDWNKVYEQFRGKTNDPGSAAHYYSEYRAGRMTQKEAIANLVKEGVRAPNVKS